MSEAGRERLNVVKEHLEHAGMKWEEISCDDVRFKVDKANKDIYVCDPMEGAAYEKLNELAK